MIPLAGAHGLVLATLYVLKPARNALFLERQGVGRLPWVLVLVAVVGGLATALYARLSKGERMEKLIHQTFIALAAILLGFRVLLELDAAWVAYAFYVWVALLGLVATSLVWLFANAVFNPREARRVFSVIGTGGIAGAIIGGAITPPLVSWIGTKDLLVASAVMIGGAVALLRLVPRVEREEPKKKRRHEVQVEPGFAAVADSDLLRRMSIMTLLIAIVAVIVEIQFNAIVDASFATRDEKTAFFGSFFAWLSAFAFIFQLVCTTRILRVFGVGPALLLLPASLALGSVALIFSPGMLSAMLLKVGDGGFRHSIHKSATEVLFLPVPAELKNRAKLFLDTTVDTLGTGIGAIAVLALTAMGVVYRELAFLSLVLVGAALVVGFSLRRAYIDAFRTALDRREIDFAALTTAVRDASAVQAFLPALESDNERQVIHALDMLSGARGPEIPVRVERLLNHGSADIRRRAVAVLTASGARGMLPKIEALLRDPDPAVRVEALHFSCTFGEGVRVERLSALLRDPDPLLSLAALGCIAEYGEAADRALIDAALIERFLGEGERARAELALLLGELEESSLRQHLHTLARDPSPLVVAKTIHSIGRARDRRFLPFLIEKLGESRYRAAARGSIASFGSDVLDELEKAIHSDDALVRRNVPRVIGEIAVQASIDALLSHLDDRDPQVGEESIKALNRLRVRGAPLALRFPREAILKAVMARIGLLHRLLAVAGALDVRAPRLVARAVEEKRRALFEQVFRLLGLAHPPRDIYNAYEALISNNKTVRASAVEFLDNLLDLETKRALLPLCDEPPSTFISIAGNDAALAHLRDFTDAWLSACAQTGIEAERSGMQGVIEKVILLQKVDVFSEVSTEQLGHLAAIAEELSKAAGQALYKEHDASDSMYIVLDGRVRLHRADTEVTVAGAGDAFGTWALFDDEPRVVAATALEPVRLLRIDKEDFIDLLADNIKITQAVLKAIVRRLRRIVR